MSKRAAWRCGATCALLWPAFFAGMQEAIAIPVKHDVASETLELSPDAGSASRKSKDQGSPLFAAQYRVGIEQLKIEYDDTEQLRHMANSEPTEVAFIWNPVSGSLTSFCLASGCIGSLCFGSGCSLSGCSGSGCGGSGCLLSACAVSGCGGSGCAGSVCVSSGCAGSVCVGSACLATTCLGSCCGTSGCLGSVCTVSVCAGSVCAISACVYSTCTFSGCYQSGCANSSCANSQCSTPNCPTEYRPRGSSVLVAVQSGEELQVGVSQAGEYSVRYQDTDGKVCNQRVVLKAGRVVTLQLKQLRKLEAVQLSVAA